MSTITHHLAPEEVMAFLDGEISETDAPAVSSHLEQCVECKAIAAKFYSTSHSLAQWTVPAIPKTLEDYTKGLADANSLGEKVDKPNIFIRATFWSWKHWTAGLGAATALLLLFLAATIPMSERHGHAQRSENGKTVFGFLNAVPGSQKLAQQSVGTGSGGGFAPKPKAGLTLNSNGPLDGAEGQVDPVLTPAPRIARVVSLSIVTKDFVASRASLDAILARRHGYAAELGATTAQNAPRSLQAALRIPAAELSSAVADLKSLGRVENESQSGEEVNQQHADLVARLTNSRRTEQRLQAILTQRTGKIGDVLEVEREIARVRSEIEAMEAEQKNLEHRVEFASVNLQLTEEYKASLNSPAASISTRIHNATVAGFKGLAETILEILLFFLETGPTLLVTALILLVPAWLLWRRYHRALTIV